MIVRIRTAPTMEVAKIGEVEVLNEDQGPSHFEFRWINGKKHFRMRNGQWQDCSGPPSKECRYCGKRHCIPGPGVRVHMTRRLKGGGG